MESKEDTPVCMPQYDTTHANSTKTEPTAEPSAEMLLQAFIKLRTLQWFKRPIAGYNPSDVRALTVIGLVQSNTRGAKISEISNHLRVAKPTVTQVLKKLESEGLIERISDETDRRVIRVRLTERGEEVFKQVGEARMNSFRELAEFLGEEQSHQLADLLTQVAFFFSEH